MIKARLTVFARGLRRRLSNLAWGLGGGSVVALIIAAIARGKLPLEQLPSFLGVGSLMAIAASLLATLAAFGAHMFLQWPRQVTASADDNGVHVQQGTRTKTYAYDAVGSSLRHRGHVWVILRNANVMDFAFDDVVEARAFQTTIREKIGERRFELVPHPTLATPPLTFFTMMLTVIVMKSMTSTLQRQSQFLILLTLAMMIAVPAVLAFALRGKGFVVGRDGVRLGKKFVSFDEIKTIQAADERVTIVTIAGKTVSARVHMAKDFGEALSAELAGRMNVEDASEGTLDRHAGEAVHAWLGRVRASIRETSFRNPAMQKERVRVAALHPKSPLRVRVAALAGLMEDDPGLARELLEVSADPRLAKAAKAAQGSVDGWRRVVERLERDGSLD